MEHLECTTAFCTSVYYTVTTLPCHVAHGTAQKVCDDNVCSILEYNLHGPATVFVKGTM